MRKIGKVVVRVSLFVYICKGDGYLRRLFSTKVDIQLRFGCIFCAKIFLKCSKEEIMVILYVFLGLLSLMLGYVAFLLCCCFLVDTKKEYLHPSPFYRSVLNGATWVGLKILRVRIHVSGVEKLPEDGKLLFVCNHRSNFDPIITWLALKKWNISFVSKPENFHVPIFGKLIRRCCFLPIDREDPRSSLQTIRKAGALLQSGEVNVGIYPEGTRNKSCRGLLEFHNGVFKIAQIADASIAVLTVTGTEQVHKNYPWHSTDVYLNVVDVISAKGRTGEIGALVREKMEYDLTQNKSEVAQ